MRCLITIALLWCSLATFAQKHSFPFGNISHRELEMKQYERDTSAVAVILDEFGEAHVDNDNDHNIIFEYHAKIKILKQGGVSFGDFEIPLYKNLSRAEKVTFVQASAFNLENGLIRESKVEHRNVFTQDVHKYGNVTKFAVPNVRVGTVIDVMFTLESPFFMNFRPWEFQSSIPKVRSEYWALIPSNYNYSIVLKGMLSLTKNDHALIKNCFTPGSSVADCIRYKFAMENIPAFIDEDFMTARSNFLAAIDFELIEIRRFDGMVDKITKKWADVEHELAESSSFGGQLRRGKDILDSQMDKLLVNESDPLAKAHKIFDFIKSTFTWNEVYGFTSELGIKKALEAKQGNVGDINLSLVAALRYAGIKVDPVILSTRRHGVVSELFPVLSDFNYVIARVNIDDKVYLLDATDKFMPFGLVPERCLNGNGRVIAAKESYWQPITPASKQRTVATYTLNLNSSGVISGDAQFVYSGYDAVYKRREIQDKGAEKFIEDFIKSMPGISVKNHLLELPDDFKKPVVLKLELQFESDSDGSEAGFYFMPVVKPSWGYNPFRSSQRLYPVDFGVPIEQITILNLQYPSEFQVDEVPELSKISLPGGGGQFLFETRIGENRLAVNHSLLISRTLYNAAEYAHLKAMFNHVLSSQEAAIVFKRN